MKKTTDKDITTTNQLIKVIKGDALSLSEHIDDKHQDPSEAYGCEDMKWGLKKLILIFFILISFFSFLSIKYFSGNIDNLLKEKNGLASLQKGFPRHSEPSLSVAQKVKLAQEIDSIYNAITDKRPYISSIIKELLYILPKNCYLNRLYILQPAGDYSFGSLRSSTLSLEATLINGASSTGEDLSDVLQAIESSPVFTDIKVGYQDRSALFNNKAIDVQLSFCLE